MYSLVSRFQVKQIFGKLTSVSSETGFLARKCGSSKMKNFHASLFLLKFILLFTKHWQQYVNLCCLNKDAKIGISPFCSFCIHSLIPKSTWSTCCKDTNSLLQLDIPKKFCLHVFLILNHPNISLSAKGFFPQDLLQWQYSKIYFKNDKQYRCVRSRGLP